jgi:hypothetical protein
MEIGIYCELILINNSLDLKWAPVVDKDRLNPHSLSRCTGNYFTFVACKILF